jgi:hypothetical protein
MNKETIKEAAITYWQTQIGRDTANPSNTAFCTRDFKAGAEWQKEQSATEAIEFFKWVKELYRESETISENDIQVTFYVHQSNGGLLQTIENLYELWLKTKE